MHDPAAETVAETRRQPAGAVAPWWHTAAIALLLVGASVLSGRQAHIGALAAHHESRYLVGIATEWAMLLVVWLGLRIKRVAMADLLRFGRGLEALAMDFAVAAVFWVAALMVLAAIGLVLRVLHFSAPEKTLMAIAPATPLELLLWMVLSISAGFCEEFVFRGYFLRQFSALGVGVWLGVLCSSLLFGVSHGYEGAAGMIAITAYGALFCALVFVRNSLRPGMIAHAWHDIFSGVMLALIRHFHVL